MISSSNYKSVEIDIITYKKKYFKAMNENRIDRGGCKNKQNRFICSICLNNNPSKEDDRNTECCKRKSNSCPICDRHGIQSSDDNRNHNNDKHNKSMHEKEEKHGKNIQTSQLDVTQGLSLLKEVLTVFQNKKQTAIKNGNNKTIIIKDACVSTDGFIKMNPTLTISKIFCYSIDDTQIQNNKFVIINSQPEVLKTSQFSIDLTKHKSSSIPQMKLEELKNSLKEKTKSKDAIEEVNRMFATFRKCDMKEASEANRPLIRCGPRILPVVKTNTFDDKPSRNCRYCQTDYRMSSGDSFECCHRTNDRCEECFHMMFCHYQQNSSGPTCSNCHKGCEHKV